MAKVPDRHKKKEYVQRFLQQTNAPQKYLPLRVRLFLVLFQMSGRKFSHGNIIYIFTF